MGQSTDAILAYGYDLGSSEDKWKIRETDEYGSPQLEWWDDEEDFGSAAERQLLAQLAGFTEQWSPDSEGYHGRKREAEAQLGAQITSYCSVDYPMYLLAAHHITVWRGACTEIDFAELAAKVEAEAWDDKLAQAVTALGITPVQEHPAWLLVSNWG